jgi:transcriptional regulator with XRE-family HTH domain
VSIKERFSANLREVRETRGITQTELGLMTELHRTEISLLENAKRTPRLDTLVKLTSALSCSADELTEGIVWKPNFKTYGEWEVIGA